MSSVCLQLLFYRLHQIMFSSYMFKRPPCTKPIEKNTCHKNVFDDTQLFQPRISLIPIGKLTIKGLSSPQSAKPECNFSFASFQKFMGWAVIVHPTRSQEKSVAIKLLSVLAAFIGTFTSRIYLLFSDTRPQYLAVDLTRNRHWGTDWPDIMCERLESVGI